MQRTDKKAIFSLSLGHFTADLYSSCLAPLYPLIATNLGINLALISMVISLAHLTASLLQPLFGYLSDRTVHRSFMFWGLILGAVFIPVVVFTPNIYLMWLCLVLAISGNALFHPQVTALIATFTYNNPTLNRNMGIFLGVGIVGYALGPVFSSTLVETFSLNALWVITISGILIAFLLYFTVPKIPPESIKKTDENFFSVMWAIIKNPAMFSLTLISVTKSLVSVTFGTYMPFLLKSYGYSLNQIGAILTLFFAFSGFASVISAKIEQRIGAKNLIRLSFFGILPLTLIFISTLKTLPPLAFCVFGILGFFTFLSVSINLVLGQKIMPENKGVVSGVIGGFSWALAALCLTPLGFIAQKFGVNSVFILVSVITFFVGIFGISKELDKVFNLYRNVKL